MWNIWAFGGHSGCEGPSSGLWGSLDDIAAARLLCGEVTRPESSQLICCSSLSRVATLCRSCESLQASRAATTAKTPARSSHVHCSHLHVHGERSVNACWVEYVQTSMNKEGVLYSYSSSILYFKRIYLLRNFPNWGFMTFVNFRKSGILKVQYLGKTFKKEHMNLAHIKYETTKFWVKNE